MTDDLDALFEDDTTEDGIDEDSLGELTGAIAYALQYAQESPVTDWDISSIDIIGEIELKKGKRKIIITLEEEDET